MTRLAGEQRIVLFDFLTRPENFPAIQHKTKEEIARVATVSLGFDVTGNHVEYQYQLARRLERPLAERQKPLPKTLSERVATLEARLGALILTLDAEGEIERRLNGELPAWDEKEGRGAEFTRGSDR